LVVQSIEKDRVKQMTWFEARRCKLFGCSVSLNLVVRVAPHISRLTLVDISVLIS
jgi:hypothetical protein